MQNIEGGEKGWFPRDLKRSCVECFHTRFHSKKYCEFL